MFEFERKEGKGWPFKSLSIGESVTVTGVSNVKCQREAHKYAHKTGKKVECEKTEKGTVVRRIA